MDSFPQYFNMKNVYSSQEMLAEYKRMIDLTCRLCGQNHRNFQPLLSNQEILRKIQIILPLTIQNEDMLPTNICDNCVVNVNETYDFYNLCVSADVRLRELCNLSLQKKLIPSQSIDTTIDNSDVIKSHNASVITVGLSDKHKVNRCSEPPMNTQLLNIENKLNIAMKNVNIVACTSCFRCDNCSTEFNSKIQLKNHILRQCKQNLKFECSKCDKSYKTYKTLTIHESTHSLQRPILCDTCGKSFRHTNNLQNHKRIHCGNKKKFTCKICSKSFFSRFAVSDHMNIHNGTTPYKCPFCSKEFRESVHLRQHRWTHLGYKFSCSICKSQFNRKGNLNQHMKKHSQANEELLKTEKPVMVSNDVIAEQKLKLNEIENKTISCNTCGKRFHHAGSLTYHRRKEHTGECPFKCSYCDDIFALNSIRLVHERKQHTGDKPYTCSHCQKAFTNPSSYSNHLYVHNANKMFTCDECGNQFTRKSALTVHKKIHLGLKDFVCDVCGKAFIQKFDMIKHKRIHESQNNPLFCKYCGISFSNKKNISDHVNCKFNIINQRQSENCKYSVSEECKKYLLDRITDNEIDIARSVRLFVQDKPDTELSDRTETVSSAGKPIVLQWTQDHNHD